MDYYEESEKTDNAYFERFNDYMKWFTITERQGHFNRIDYYCTDKKGRNVSVELKLRYNTINTFDSIFIEEEKFSTMINKFNNENFLPLFINFFQNGDNVAVWDLRKYADKKPELIEKIILDPGVNQTKLVKRYLLPTKDAHYYEFENNKFIQRW